VTGSSKPLADLKVLDLGTFVAAPFCATMLAEFGAEVIKIEAPGTGDSLRTLGVEHEGVPLFWLQESRNKHAVTCNLREPEGQEVIRDFVRNGYNVIVENFRPGTLERWGLGYEDLSAIDPSLIMGRISGYGQDGPNRDLPGFGRIAHAFSGLTYLCGFPELPPANPGSATIADYLSGLFVAFGVLVADRARKTSGRGQVIDLALYESIFRILDSLAITYSVTGQVRERVGTATALAAPHNHYPTKDGRWVAIACTNDRIFKRLAQLMDQPELTQDARFSSERARVANRAAIDEVVERWTRSMDGEALIEALRRADIPSSPIFSIADIFADPHYASRGNLVALEHPQLGEFKMPGVAPRLSATPGEIEWLGRGLGEDTAAVLSGALGYSRERIDTLRQRGVV
jgi:crotonobetainyl-CoA:carnitine CoA-transferase CaiB-like acyl-CoA transferase